jgi:hypothetical protein
VTKLCYSMLTFPEGMWWMVWNTGETPLRPRHQGVADAKLAHSSSNWWLRCPEKDRQLRPQAEKTPSEFADHEQTSAIEVALCEITA